MIVTIGIEMWHARHVVYSIKQAIPGADLLPRGWDRMRWRGSIFGNRGWAATTGARNRLVIALNPVRSCKLRASYLVSWASLSTGRGRATSDFPSCCIGMARGRRFADSFWETALDILYGHNCRIRGFAHWRHWDPNLETPKTMWGQLCLGLFGLETRKQKSRVTTSDCLDSY